MQAVNLINKRRDGSLAGSTVTDALDVEVLRTFERVKSDDGSDLVVELIDLYLQGTPQRIQDIRKAAADRELVSLKRLAHTVKGSSSTLGLRRVAGICQQLETASATSSVRLDSLALSLESRFAEAREALMAERKRRLQ